MAQECNNSQGAICSGVGFNKESNGQPITDDSDGTLGVVYVSDHGVSTSPGGGGTCMDLEDEV